MGYDRIIVNGAELDEAGLMHSLDDSAHGSPDAGWTERLKETARELIAHEGLNVASSGTTGPPKRFRIPVADIEASARLTARTFGLNTGNRVLHCLPAEFVAGKLMLARAFVLGLDITFINPRGSILDHLSPDARFDFVAMVPLQLHRALEEDRARVEERFGTILLGGGPVSYALTEAVHGLRNRIVLGYGSTETVTHVAIREMSGLDPDDRFKAIGDCHFARDPRGCLVVYTPHLTVKQHVTNDLVELIDDTHFNWLGRFDHVILSGGKKIHPEQLETRTASLLPYPHFFSATPDPVLGQAVMLTLECDRPQAEVMPEVIELLMPHLHPHEWPRRVIVLPRIARTVSGKIIRG